MRRYRIDGPAGWLGGWFRPAAPASAASPPLPGVVLVHGMHQSSEHWVPLADHLRPGRPILAVELRGHGRSDVGGPHGLSPYTEDVLRAVAEHELDAVHLVGTSFGASVAVAVAARLGSRARSLLALAGARFTGKDRDVRRITELVRQQGVHGFFSYTAPRFTFPPKTSEAVVTAHVEQVVAGRDVETVVAIFEGTYGTDVGPAARQVRCPALVVSGELDRTCPPRSGRELADALGCPHRVLAGVAHVPAVECPDRVAALLGEHIAAAEQPVTAP